MIFNAGDGNGKTPKNYIDKNLERILDGVSTLLGIFYKLFLLL